MSKKRAPKSYVRQYLTLALTSLLGGIYYSYFTVHRQVAPPQVAEISQPTCAQDTHTCGADTVVTRSGPACNFTCPDGYNYYPENNVNAVSATIEASPPATFYQGEEHTFDINVRSVLDHIKAVEVEFNYDPDIVQILSFEPSDYLPREIVAADIGSGTTYAVYAVEEGQAGKPDWGHVGFLKLKASKPGEQTVYFGANTSVSVDEHDLNALLRTRDIKFKVLYKGDLNKDGRVDIYDYSKLIDNFGSPYTIYDYSDIITNFDKSI